MAERDPDPASLPAPAPASKRAKIWQRTRYGAGLALGLAGVVWLAQALGNELPVLIGGSLIALLALLEASLMGRLFLRGLPVILVVPLAGVVLIEWASLKRPATQGPWAQLALEVLVAAALAALVHALTRWMSRRTTPRQVLILVLCGAMAGGFGWLDATGSSPMVAWRTIAAIAGAVLLGALATGTTSARRRDLAISIGLAVWIAVPLPALAQVARLWHAGGLVSLLLLSKIGDVAGYYIGSAIGRRHPFPKLSPGKTVAGCVGSFVVAVIAGGVLSATGLFPESPLGVAAGLLAAAGINLAAQAGDLTESWVKRRAGVKDSSSWLGPSGGILDVVDSVLFTIPTALLLWPLLFPV